MYYIIKIRISLSYADVNFTMNSLCNETVKRYISSVVINLSASRWAQWQHDIVPKWEIGFTKSHAASSWGFWKQCVRREAPLVSRKGTSHARSVCITFGHPKWQTSVGNYSKESQWCTFCTLGNFLGWPWSTEQAEERDEEVNTFLRTQDITSTV